MLVRWPCSWHLANCWLFVNVFSPRADTETEASRFVALPDSSAGRSAQLRDPGARVEVCSRRSDRGPRLPIPRVRPASALWVARQHRAPCGSPDRGALEQGTPNVGGPDVRLPDRPRRKDRVGVRLSRRLAGPDYGPQQWLRSADERRDRHLDADCIGDPTRTSSRVRPLPVTHGCSSKSSASGDQSRFVTRRSGQLRGPVSEL